ncbi:MAG: ABC transporter permease [Clostridiales bacterium]|jgi:ABC-type antimicrobial peptide transport system permease subunit|nr:ABC transporter permease [Clostridiales bacterium]
MNNLDVVSMCARSLLKRKLRTFLTVLGVVIGVASIVVMISLGLAVNDRFDKELKNMGDATVITVYNYGSVEMIDDAGQGLKRPAPVLDDNAVANFGRIPGVRAAAAFQQMYLYMKSGRYVLPGITVYGIDPKIMDVFYEASEGRLLEAGNDRYGMVFGINAELNFYKKSKNTWYSERVQQYWMGEEDQPRLVDLFNSAISVSIDSGMVFDSSETIPGLRPFQPIRAECVGVLKSYGYQADNAIFMDITTVRKLQADQRKREQAANDYYNAGSSVGVAASRGARQPVGYETVQVKCDDMKSVRAVSKEIKSMGFYAEFPSESLDSLQSMAAGMQALLGAIGAVSLLVAAIGIANTMIMSIYERTREIGVMKVIGAALSDIRKLFLLEAVMIGFTGGVLGILLSLFISYLLNSSEFSFFSVFTANLSQESDSVISLITPWLCGAAAFFSTLIGLISGYFPARRAMRLSAVNALNNV